MHFSYTSKITFLFIVSVLVKNGNGFMAELEFANQVITNVNSVFKAVNEFIAIFNDNTSVKNSANTFIEHSSGITGEVILKELYPLFDKFDHLEYEISQFSTSLNRFTMGMQAQIAWGRRMEKLEDHLSRISQTYNRLKLYKEINAEKETIIGLASHIVSPNENSVLNTLDFIHGLFKPKRKSLFLQYKQILDKKSKDTYTNPDAEKLALINLFEKIVQAEFQGISMIIFAYSYLAAETGSIYDAQPKFSSEITGEIRMFKTNIIRMRDDIVPLINTSHLYYRCDPESHTLDQTYYKFTRVVQGYIENERELSRHSNCSGQCSSNNGKKSAGCWRDPGNCKKKKACNGKLDSCTNIQSNGPSVTACLSLSGTRRYDQIKLQRPWKTEPLGIALGRDCLLPHTLLETNSGASCPICFCYCDDPLDPLSHRHISLRASLTDIENNKVVTGVTFFKTGDMLHIVVQQGIALPFGDVNETSLSWKEEGLFNSKDDYVDEYYDYVKLTLKERTFDLDLLQAPSGFVITGVKFGKFHTHLRLQIRVTEINTETGELNTDQTKWIYSDVTPTSSNNPREEYRISDLDLPTRSPKSSYILADNNKFIKVSPSSLNKDAGQNPIPFIDAQPVIPSIPMWLTKMGLYYKGRKKYGGFLGIQIDTSDIGMKKLIRGIDLLLL